MTFELAVRRILPMVVQLVVRRILQMVARKFWQMETTRALEDHRLEDCMHPQRIRPGVVPRSATLAAFITLG